jgi:major vault protein
MGYAVLVLGKNGQRRVVMGPDSTLLAFDESLQVLQLSTGKPKNTDQLLRTAYLLVANNTVSDVVRVVTGDMVEVEIRVSYRVNFEGETETERLRWFSTANYVKFLCDHARSRLRSAAKRVGIEELNATVTQLVRDTILGVAEDGKKRTGLFFEENGMRICDVEVLHMQISDERIRGLLVNAQHTSVTQALQIGEAERSFRIEQRKQVIERDKLLDREETEKVRSDLQKSSSDRSLMLQLAEIESRSKAFAERKELEAGESTHETAMTAAGLDRQKAEQAVGIAYLQATLKLDLEKLAAEAVAYEKRFGAVSPQFIAALQAFGDSAVVTEATKSLGVMSIFGGGSVAEVLHRVFRGTKLEGAIDALKSLPTNGGSAKA